MRQALNPGPVGLLVVVAFAVFLASGAARAGTPVSGGTAVVGLEQGVPCLDVLSSACNTSTTLWTTENTLLGAYSVTPGIS